MKLEEWQAKKILESFKIPVPENAGVVDDRAQAAAALKKAGTPPWVLKAQVQTGGRGKAGGIRVAKTREQVKQMIGEMLGMKLVTAQTGPEGVRVGRLLLEKPVKIQRELYLSVVLDRRIGAPTLIASSEGGMDIEQLAEKSPEKLITLPLNPLTGLEPFQARELLFKLNLYGDDPKQNRRRADALQNVVRAFLGSDASLLEVNPLALTAEGELMALDAKIVIDDSGLYRHPELAAYENLAELSAAERKARKAGISYISLNGRIGCMVNGAGLAMATMDLIKQHGGDPANFLDVGGGANVKQVTTAFKLILSDKRVRTIFVNIFGGIMRCDVIAEGIVAAVKEAKLSVPLVVRLQGNKASEGGKILSASKLNIVSEGDLSKAARKAVELSKQGNGNGHDALPKR